MSDVTSLLQIMNALRDPVTGCPWDIKQNFESIAPYTIEEAYEVADAIERKNYPDLKEELGDLLLQVVFHSQMAAEQQLFDFNDVVTGLANKLITRHPHVFAEEQAKDEAQVKVLWEAKKAQERQEKNKRQKHDRQSSDNQISPSLLDDIPSNMPALMRTHKLQKRVAQVGFDWTDMEPVVEKVREELSEVEVEIQSGDKDKLQEELGDLLFVVANLVRRAGFKSEDTLRLANQKFERRFKGIEALLQKQNLSLEQSSLEELDALWETVKQKEKQV